MNKRDDWGMEEVSEQRAHDVAYHVEIEWAEKGMRFRPGRIPGGKKGRWRERSVKAQYGRVVWKRGAAGLVPVKEEFPDKHTEMDPFRMLQLSVQYGVSDLEIVSEYALYGMKAFPAVSVVVGSGKLGG
eukprot:COSAG02_NODE_1842_length_10700_cov_148.785869_7_plen_129_part_00